jgi:starvation-inducible DNA-binding protein
MKELVKAARVAFASEYSFFVKAQNFHWNVEGPDFFQYHELFEKIYSEVYDSLDTFAEQIRALGGYAPGSYQKFSMLSKIEDENNILDKTAMTAELLQDSLKIVKILKITFQRSEEFSEYGFSDFVAGRIDAHRKHEWMLRSSLKNG